VFLHKIWGSSEFSPTQPEQFRLALLGYSRSGSLSWKCLSLFIKFSPMSVKYPPKPWCTCEDTPTFK